MKTLNHFFYVIIATTLLSTTQLVGQELTGALATISETPGYFLAKAKGENLFPDLGKNIPIASRTLAMEQNFINKPEMPVHLATSLSMADWNKLELTDDGSALLKIPFAFTFFDSIQNTVWVNANGNLSFGSSVGTYTPEYFPLNVQMIAPFWADLRISSKYENSGIYFLEEENSLRILFRHMALNGEDPSNTLTFEVILRVKSPTINDNLAFAYHHISPKIIEALVRNQEKGKPMFVAGINSGDMENHVLIQLFDNLIYSFSPAKSQMYGMMDADYYVFNLETQRELVHNYFVD